MSLKSILKGDDLERIISFDDSLTHIVFKGERDRLADVFSWDRLNDCLNSLPLPSEAVRLFKEGSALSYSNSLELMTETMSGATLIFDDLDQYDPGLGKFVDCVTGEIGFPTRTNLYLSYPETQGFFAHYDTHSFLILQISGSKEWAIYEEKELYPLYYQKLHNRRNLDDLNLAEKVLLDEGDILFVPKGQWHDATAKGGPSVHLTLGLFAPTGIDFLNWLCDELRSSTDCRMDFPWGVSPLARGQKSSDQMLLEAMEKVKLAIDQQFSDNLLAQRFLAHRAATSKVRNRLHYPSHIFSRGSFEDYDSFYLASKTIGYFRNEISESISIAVGGLQFEAPMHFLSVLDVITTQNSVTYQDLVSAPDVLDRDELDDFIFSLLKYGILARN